MTSEAITENVLLEFLSKYVADVENGTPRSRAEYCSLYPSHAERIGQEFDALEAATGAGRGTVLPRVPETIGPFRIRSRLGSGGQGTVYLAEDSRLGRDVALKVVPSVTPLGGHLLSERAHREAVLTSQVDHIGICQIHEIGREQPFCYIAMQWIDGEPLSRRIAAARAADDSEHIGVFPGATDYRSHCAATAEFVERAAKAIHHCHEAGILHRDLKPGNVMVTRKGRPVLLDFGLARSVDNTDPVITQRNEVLGTPAYSSPEQILGNCEVDRRTDVWSLGVVLYECLTLDKPFQAPTISELHEAIRRDEPLDPRRVEPRLPIDLARIVQKAIEKNPDSRYRTAAELAADLRRFRRREPVLARTVGPRVRLHRWAQRNPALAVSTALAVLLFLAGLTVTTVFLHRESDLRERAETDHREAHRLAQAFLFDADNALLNLPGSTAARRAVIEQAMTYLESVRQQLPRDPVVRCDLSEAHLRLGTVLGNAKTFNLGMPGAALAQYESGLALAALDGTEDAKQTQALESVRCRLHKRIADLHYSERRYARSVPHYENARDLIVETLGTADLPFAVMLEINYSSALFRTGETERSAQLLEICRERIAGTEREHGRDVFVLDAWSRWHEVHAGRLEQRDQFREAVEGFEESLRLSQLALATDQSGRMELGLASLGRANLGLASKGSMQRVASVARALGRLHTRFGKEDRGLECFEQAHEILAQLHAENPADYLCASRHFTVVAELATFYLVRGDVRTAKGRMTNAVEIGRGLTVRFPGSADLADTLCSAEVTLGDIFMRVGEQPAAIGILRASRDRIAAQNPTGIAEPGEYSRVAMTEAKLGQALLATGATAEAIVALRAANVRYEALLSKGIGSMMHGTALAFTKRELADALREEDPDSSEQLFREALALLDGLEQRRDGGGPPRERVHLTAGTHLALGQLYESRERWSDADTSYAASIAIGKQRLALHPGDFSVRIMVARYLHMHARCRERQDLADDAAALRAESLDLWAGILERFPEDARHAYWAGMVSWCRGRNLTTAGDTAAAKRCCERALELWQPLRDRGYVPPGVTPAAFDKSYAELNKDLIDDE